LHLWRDPAIEKIMRIRGIGDTVELCRSWLPVEGIDLPAPSNRLTALVVSGTVGCLLACLLLLVLYHVLLGRGVAGLLAAVPQ